jgi:hypothetical protein
MVMLRKFILFVPIYLMIVSCSLFSPMKEISLSIEELPDCLIPALAGRWIIKQASLSGDICEIEKDWTDGLPDSFILKSPREEDFLLLLYPPKLVEGCSMNPLGAFVPSYKKSGQFSLKDGSAVSILLTLIDNNLYVKDFNCSRFILEMAELDDPWLVEEQTLLKQLGRKEMRSWYIRSKTLFSIEISLPEGLWFGPSLLQEALESSAPEAAVEIDLPEGHNFIYCPERAEVVEIQVDGHGEAVWITTSLP